MWSIGFLTLIMPWLVVRGIDEPFLAPKLLAWLAGAWALILTTWFGRARLATCPAPPLLWFGGWVALSGLLGFYVPYLLRPVGSAVTVSGDQWLATIYVLTGLATISVLQHYVSIRPCVAKISAWCCWTAFAMAIYQAIQWLGLDQVYTQDMQKVLHETLYRYRPYAGLGNIQFVAMTQALTLPLFLLFRSRRYLVMLAVVLAAIALSGVRFAQVIALSALGAYGFARAWYQWSKHRRLLLMTVCAIALVSGPIGVRRLCRDERWVVWSEVIYQWRQPTPSGRPMALTGWGLDSFKERFWLTVRTLRPETVAKLGMPQIRYDVAHSDVLQVLYELGLIGLVLVLGSIGFLLWNGWRLASTPVGAAWWASGLGLCGFSLVYFPWHLAQSVWMGSLIVAMNLRQPEGVVG